MRYISQIMFGIVLQKKYGEVPKDTTP